MASLSVILFVSAITAALFYVGFKIRFTNHEVADLIIRRCAVLLGLFSISLILTMLATIAENAALGITSEIFTYLWIINWTIYVSMVALIFVTAIKSLKLWSVIVERKRYGEE